MRLGAHLRRQEREQKGNQSPWVRQAGRELPWERLVTSVEKVRLQAEIFQTSLLMGYPRTGTLFP